MSDLGPQPKAVTWPNAACYPASGFERIISSARRPRNVFLEMAGKLAWAGRASLTNQLSAQLFVSAP